MSKQTKLGQIITVLFPEFVERFFALTELRNEAKMLKVNYRFKGVKPTMQEMEKYYTIVYKHHDEKMWFMNDIPSLGSNNKVF